MSIFNSIPKCEICHERDCKPVLQLDAEGTMILTSYRNRCSYCELRYDGKGEPFIIYCDTYRLVKMSKPRIAVVIWAIDDRVVKVPPTYAQYMGFSAAKLCDLLIERGFDLEYINQASY